MSRRNSSQALKLAGQAEIFAALADVTRLRLVQRLIDGEPHSIADLTEGTGVTRQAISKHLSVLQNVGLVNSQKDGRENLFELNPKPLATLQEYLDVIAAEWDQSLGRLKAFVED